METSCPNRPINTPVSFFTNRQVHRTGSALNLRIIVGSIRFDVRLLTNDRNLLATLWLRCRLDQAEQCGGDEAKCKLQNDKRQKRKLIQLIRKLAIVFVQAQLHWTRLDAKIVSCAFHPSHFSSFLCVLFVSHVNLRFWCVETRRIVSHSCLIYDSCLLSSHK